jgi:2-keto-4-pentenoate hydratase/2-oxohepta-3-ene-1,7-dioic acid hydratase in catechol pathway
MKLLTFGRPDGTESWGILKNERIVDLRSHAPRLKHALWAMTSLAEEAARHADLRPEDVTPVPPIPDPDKILCVGLNYVSHGEAMVRPNASATFDYEGELAVIIGRRCRHVRKADWERVVAGYSCYTDGSIRKWQRHCTHFIPGKNFDKSGAFGPGSISRR